MLEMTNGCICWDAPAGGNLLVEVVALAAGRVLQRRLAIESTGISEPLPVAETFTFRDEAGTSLSDLARLDTLVTVVDAVAFPPIWRPPTTSSSAASPSAPTTTAPCRSC